LDQIRGTTGWVEFGQYLATFDKDAWQSVARRALKGTLVVTELDSTIRVELPGSIASELGATNFQFVRIEHDTPIMMLEQRVKFDKTFVKNRLVDQRCREELRKGCF
jgi:uncharacterized membrane protein